jgi:hypothetical protein
MAYSYNLGNRVAAAARPSLQQGSTQAEIPQYGRVIDIVLDNSKKILDKNGKALPIGAITYRSLNANREVENTVESALPLKTTGKQFPLKNEVVILQQSPTADINKNSNQKQIYYGEVVNLWGATNHNAMPDPGYNIETVLGEGAIELGDVNPLYPFPGDYLIEGRQGQSIRIGGYTSRQSTLTGNSNNGKPYIIISNGQIKTDNGVDHIVEDINEDPNSLYFLTDHQVKLTPANEKRDAYNTPPISAKQYVGNQVVLNGGRLFFNAKEESIFLSAKESVGLNADTVNIDATSFFCVDSKKIYLGSGARVSSGREPVILGTQLENWLETLLDTLDDVATAMSSAAAVSGGPVPQLISVAPQLKAVVASLKIQMKTFQSNKVFTE